MKVQSRSRSEWPLRLVASAAILTFVWSWDGRRQQSLSFEDAARSLEAGQDSTAAVWAHCHRAILALHGAAARGGDLAVNARAALDDITVKASR